MLNRVLSVTTFVVTVALFVGPSALQAQSIPSTLIAKTNDSVPGLPGVTYKDLIGSCLTSSGEILFFGTIQGTGVTPATNWGVWEGYPGSFQMLLRSGTQAADAPAGVNYFSLGWGTFVADNGAFTFTGTMSGPGVTSANAGALWSGRVGAVEIVARDGNPAPGLPAGIVYSGLSGFFPSVNRAGTIAFLGKLTGTGVDASNDLAAWVGTEGNVSLFARTGDAAPGTGGAVYSDFFDYFYITGSGNALLKADLTGTGVTTANNSGYWYGTPGSVQLMARKGDPAPGTQPGITWMGLSDFPSVGGGGNVLFRGTLTGPGVTAASDRGFWLGNENGVQLVAREGDAAPGIPGVNYGAFGSSLDVDSIGRVLFETNLTGAGVTSANNFAIWYGTPEDLQVLVRRGDTLPGLSATTTFDLSAGGKLGSSNGVLLSAILSGPDVHFSANEKILLFGTPGNLMTVVREGDIIDVDPGPGVSNKVVESFSSFSVTDAGIMWTATFDDMTSAVMLSPVPEPSIVLGLAAVILGTVRISRRRRQST